MTPADLAAANVRQVYAIAAEQHARIGGEFDDLVGDGMVGLMQAAQRFDPSRFDGPFATYARSRVIGEMLDGYRRRYYVGHHGNGGFRGWISLDEDWPVLGRVPSAEDEAIAVIDLRSRLARPARQFRYPQRAGWCRSGHQVIGENAVHDGGGRFRCRICHCIRKKAAA